MRVGGRRSGESSESSEGGRERTVTMRREGGTAMI